MGRGGGASSSSSLPPSETFAFLKFGQKTIEKLEWRKKFCIAIDFAALKKFLEEGQDTAILKQAIVL